MDAHLVRQDHVNTAVKILPELELEKRLEDEQNTSNVLTLSTLFLLDPTLKMPTVLRPCSSRYLNSEQTSK